MLIQYDSLCLNDPLSTQDAENMFPEHLKTKPCMNLIIL